ncbi:uncharacterized protein [Amphiura filiformis]|uniref:uncharacterized protein n=1 Tax=Amphiura filiformis TaxID=82378 RepID=UPI003B21B4FE
MKDVSDQYYLLVIFRPSTGQMHQQEKTIGVTRFFHYQQCLHRFQPHGKDFEITAVVQAELLHLLTPLNGQAPANLFEGLTIDPVRELHIHHMVQIHAQLNANNIYFGDFSGFVEDMIDGFTDNAVGTRDALRALFPVLVPSNQNTKKGIKISPANSKENRTICDGVLHALVYGRHTDLPEIRNRVPGRQSRLRHRVLLPKKIGNRSRSGSSGSSGSRSPSPVNNIRLSSRYTNNVAPIPTVNDMVANPNDFELRAGDLHEFVESHAPGAVTFQVTTDDNSHQSMKIQLVIEVSSRIEEGGLSTVEEHLAFGTEQNFQQCLAALSEGQQQIYGLLVVPNGMKMIKVEESNGTYEVCETDLVTWGSQEIIGILQLISDILEQDF